MTYLCHPHSTQNALLRKHMGQTSHLTSAPNTALRTQPLPLRNGLGGLSYAAHVVGSRAAITAQQAAPKATQHTQICVAIILKQLGGGSWCFFFTVIIISLQRTHTDLCCHHPQTTRGLQVVLLLHCQHHFPAKHSHICVAIILKQLRGGSWSFFFAVIIIALQSIHRSVLPSFSNSSGAAAGPSSSLSSSLSCKGHIQICVAIILK